MDDLRGAEEQAEAPREPIGADELGHEAEDKSPRREGQDDDEGGGLPGCMLAEDTDEHRELFGPDGDCVRFFRNPKEAAERAALLVANPAERARLAAALRARVAIPQNTYGARLVTMLETASALRARTAQVRAEA